MVSSDGAVGGAHRGFGQHHDPRRDDQGRLPDLRRQRPQRLDVTGPHCDGWPINHIVGDAATGTIWAGGGGDWHGAGVWRSDDGGESWQVTRLTKGEMDDWAAKDADFARMIGWTEAALPFGDRFAQILVAVPRPRPALCRNQAGEPAAEHRRRTDLGADRRADRASLGRELGSRRRGPRPAHDPPRPGEPRKALDRHLGGGCIRHRGRRRDLGAPQPPLQCGGSRSDTTTRPRRGTARPGIACTTWCAHPGTEDLLYQQNHHGVWRSANGGRSWDDITEGLPSTFGFPIRVHPRDPDTIWTLPLNGDSAGRFPPDAAAAVWRSRDGGQSWQAMREGLPQVGCFFTVLRQAMAGDARDPAGVYFGTNSGSVFASLDEGETWLEVARHLPTILAVEVLDRADPAATA